jgi:NADH:ubiquinone oxidoreductase subunit 2 (subunit N)
MEKTKNFKIDNLIANGTYTLFKQYFVKEFGFTFDTKDLRLLITLVETKAVNSYNTAFVFLSIYGAYRNLCVGFFCVGIMTILLNVTQNDCWSFGLIMILFSLISLQGYVRFYKYFVSQIVSAYININNERQREEHVVVES